MKNKRNIAIISGAVAVVAIIIGLIIYQQSKGPAANFFLSGGSKGKGVSVFVPSQLTAVQDPSNNLKFFEEDYPGTKNTKTTLALTSSTVADAANTASQIKQTLKTPQSVSYLRLNSILGTFIQNTSASGPKAINPSDPANKFLLSAPATFTSKHIKDNAWKFTYSYSHPGATKGQTIKVNGYLIYIIGKKAAYRLLVSSENSNWQASQATWNKISDSLTINI
jgi:hypothetical protein